jgi:hypothetical protein
MNNWMPTKHGPRIGFLEFSFVCVDPAVTPRPCACRNHELSIVKGPAVVPKGRPVPPRTCLRSGSKLIKTVDDRGLSSLRHSWAKWTPLRCNMVQLSLWTRRLIPEWLRELKSEKTLERSWVIVWQIYSLLGFRDSLLRWFPRSCMSVCVF